MFCDHDLNLLGARRRNFTIARVVAVAIFLAAPAAHLAAKAKAKHSSVDPAASDPGQNLSRELKGSLDTRPGQRLRLSTDLGTVHIHTTSGSTVDYRVVLETDASSDGASELLKQFTMTTRATPDGVTIHGD